MVSFSVSSGLCEMPFIFYLLRIKTIEVPIMLKNSISNFIILGFHDLFSFLGNFTGDSEVRSSHGVKGSLSVCCLSACT